MKVLLVLLFLLPGLVQAQRSKQGSSSSATGAPTGQCCNPAGQLVAGNPHQTNCGFNNGVFYPAQNGQCFTESNCCKRRNGNIGSFVNCVLPQNECSANQNCRWIPGCNGGTTGSSSGGSTGTSGPCCKAKANATISYDCSMSELNLGHPMGVYYAKQRCVQVNQGASCEWSTQDPRCVIQESTSACVSPSYYMNYTTIPQTSSEYSRCKYLAGTVGLTNNMCCVDPSKL